MSFALRPADPNDLSTVLTWIHSPADLRFWGGPLLTYPPDVEKTWREICADEHNTFALVDLMGSLAGFGQTLPRPPNTVHLGRIILSPAMRGQGLGRVLVRALIDSAQQSFHPGAITLNVYRGNLPAVQLYRSLGFKVVAEDEEHESYAMRLACANDPS